MPVNTTQTKYFQNIGPGAGALSFSTIASTMGRPGTNIRFGDYRRKTGANEVFADVNGTADEKAVEWRLYPMPMRIRLVVSMVQELPMRIIIKFHH